MELGSSILKENYCNRKFRSLFGTSPLVCSKVWNKLNDESVNTRSEGEPKHLLWALILLKTYSTEHVMRSILGADEKSLRKWVWYYVSLLASLKVVWYSILFNLMIYYICLRCWYITHRLTGNLDMKVNMMGKLVWYR